MVFCGKCGATMAYKIPPGDDRERDYCDVCGHVDYLNPKIIVACIPRWQDKIMLCKRGIEPRHGYWTIPGGFMEMRETTEQGAIRETWEETRAKVTIDRLHGVYNMPEINQVYLVYLADLASPDFETTPESTEIRLVRASEIPWDAIAFRVLKKALRQYVDDTSYGKHGVHHDTVFKNA